MQVLQSAMNAAPFLTGQLLLAMPGIGDPRFERAVIAMCAHDENGALGIGIGRIMPRVGLHQLLEQFDIDCDGVADVAVHQGGPVEPQRGFVLHSRDWGGQETIQVADRWGLTGTLDVLRVIGRPNGPSRWLVALGYAGWGAGQLDGELHRHGWHIATGDDTLVFDRKAEDRWTGAFRGDGIDPALLASASGNA
jgi:putative transcriptional regulator